MNILNPNYSSLSDTTSELSGLIAQHPFLSGLKEQHQQVLTDCAMLEEFSTGEYLFREGDLANRFYLILEGKVILESTEKDQETVIIQEIGPPDVIGWSWLFPPYYWRFDARAVEQTRVVFFYGTRLLERCEEDARLGYDLMKRMSQVIINRLQATRKELLKLRRERRP